MLASLSQWFPVGNPLDFNWQTGEFALYNDADPLEKIVVAPGIDFLLNFVAQTTFGPTATPTGGRTPWPRRGWSISIAG